MAQLKKQLDGASNQKEIAALERVLGRWDTWLIGSFIFGVVLLAVIGLSSAYLQLNNSGG